jgi:hypothetical protein
VHSTRPSPASASFFDEILKLKQEPGKDILLGGVDIPSQLMERLQLKLVESKILKSGCVGLRYLKE